MKEENKSPEMAKALDSMTKSMFGRKRSTSINSRDCVSCGEVADEFNDELSKKEYGISGLCQECQDSVFG
jgi:hypothetical protein